MATAQRAAEHARRRRRAGRRCSAGLRRRWWVVGGVFIDALKFECPLMSAVDVARFTAHQSGSLASRKGMPHWPADGNYIADVGAFSSHA